MYVFENGYAIGFMEGNHFVRFTTPIAHQLLGAE